MKKIQIIALLSALVMFVSGYLYLSSYSKDNSNALSSDEVVNVVVAAMDIEPYTTLTSDMVVVKTTAANAVITDSYSSVDDVIGKISASAIYSGEVLNSSRVVKDDDTKLGLAAQLEDGKRAVTIDVDTEQGVANNIKVGNYVDVIYISQIEAAEINGVKPAAGMYFTGIYGVGKPDNTQVMDETLGQYFTLVALQNIKVVALDISIGNDFADQTQEYASVTLEVTTAEAAKLALLNDNGGKVQLILRPLEDDSTVTDIRDSILKLS